MLEKFKRMKSKNEDDAVIEAHHVMMKEYGFIPVEQLRKMPIPMVSELLELIVRDGNDIKKSMRKRR